MDAFRSPGNPAQFLLFFVLLWFGVTTLLGLLSGWYILMRRFPDRPDPALHTFRYLSGLLGLVGMQRILTISVCHCGLRIGMMRLFGPFCRDFLVPWDAIRVRRKDRYFWRTATLEFGSQGYPRLSIPNEVADRLARAASQNWPEAGPFPEESNTQSLSRIAKQWQASTVLAATFFIVVPRIAAPNGAHPPIAVAILFPAIVFGMGGVYQYLRRRRD